MCLEKKIVWLHMKYLALPNISICKKYVFFFKFFLYLDNRMFGYAKCCDLDNGRYG